jgi:pimeloyl-ACP methyl ester carboxylesterase
MHRTGDFMRHVACRQLAERGFLAVCLNPRSENNEAIAEWDNVMLDVQEGVRYARQLPGIRHVALFGHSGGGAVMTSYQATAEAGHAYCDAPGKISHCSEKLEGLAPADAVVLADAHPGDAVMNMRDLNPSLEVREDGTIERRADLDPLNPANGFDPKASHYPKAFLERYAAAQAAEMGRLIDQAQAKATALKASGLTRLDGDLVTIPVTKGVGWLTRLDADFEGARRTARPEKLLNNNGSITTQIVTSVAVTTPPAAHEAKSDVFYLKAFLSSHAIRAENSQDRIDYCSSNDSSICAIGYVKVPTLIEAMGGYLFVRDGERLLEHSAAKDKDYIVIAGALHSFSPCTACETTPGQYSNTIKNMFDYIGAWAHRRFPGD